MQRRALLTIAATAIGSAFASKSLGATTKEATTIPEDGAVHLPARVIAPPKSISEPARAYLASLAKQPYEVPPPASDSAAWQRASEEHSNKMLARIGPIPKLPGVDVETRVMGGVTVYVAIPVDTSSEARKPQLMIHGGGWVNLGGKMAMLLTQAHALQYGGTVFGVDYRMPPHFPFPTPLEDCLSVYREMLKSYPANKILVSGGSAGGNLAAALMLKARDTGLPPPCALFLDTPITDLTGISDSLQTNQGLDVLLKQWPQDANVAVYAHGADLNNPYLSPLKGDLSQGFPPTYLRTGTRDLFLSDTVRMHAALRKAGVEADLYVGEARPHSGFGLRTPEDEDARVDTVKWLKRYWVV